MKQESIEHAKFRALAQIIIDKEKGIESFQEYMKLAFPYLEASKKRDRESFIKKLSDEVRRGAIAVKALPVPKFQSKLRTKIMEYGPALKKTYDVLSKRSNIR